MQLPVSGWPKYGKVMTTGHLILVVLQMGYSRSVMVEERAPKAHPAYRPNGTYLEQSCPILMSWESDNMPDRARLDAQRFLNCLAINQKARYLSEWCVLPMRWPVMLASLHGKQSSHKSNAETGRLVKDIEGEREKKE
jgi:hypothetical protein